MKPNNDHDIHAFLVHTLNTLISGKELSDDTATKLMEYIMYCSLPS